jgi:hypothetical protein
MQVMVEESQPRPLYLPLPLPLMRPYPGMEVNCSAGLTASGKDVKVKT